MASPRLRVANSSLGEAGAIDDPAIQVTDVRRRVAAVHQDERGTPRQHRHVPGYEQPGPLQAGKTIAGTGFQQLPMAPAPVSQSVPGVSVSLDDPVARLSADPGLMLNDLLEDLGGPFKNGLER